jgi:hypothetical protein
MKYAVLVPSKMLNRGSEQQVCRKKPLRHAENTNFCSLPTYPNALHRRTITVERVAMVATDPPITTLTLRAQPAALDAYLSDLYLRSQFVILSLGTGNGGWRSAAYEFADQESAMLPSCPTKSAFQQKIYAMHYGAATAIF